MLDHVRLLCKYHAKAQDLAVTLLCAVTSCCSLSCNCSCQNVTDLKALSRPNLLSWTSCRKTHLAFEARESLLAKSCYFLLLLV